MAVDIADVVGEASVRRLNDLIGDRTDAVVAVATPEGEMVWASAPGSREMFGRELEEFEHHSQFEYIHPDDHALFRAKLQLAAEGETVRYSVRAMAADGTYVPISSIAWSVQTNDGRLIVSLAVPVDTTSSTLDD